MAKSTPKVKRKYVRRKTTIATPDITVLHRIAIALERLVALQTASLNARGIPLGIPAGNPEEEGEISVTDDAAVAAILERLRLNRPRDTYDSGIYIGDAPGGGIPKEEAGQAEEVTSSADFRWRDSQLFGSGWGFNTGPEGAEEGGASLDSLGSTANPVAGHVPR
jgi:hypothetical protein